MAISQKIKKQLKELKKEYDSLKIGKESLLTIVNDAEIPENVYNSNAIENSTLTLKETEKILLEMEVERDLNLREVFEAKNLARVSEYIHKKSDEKEIDQELILLLHQMLIGGINDDIAGRFRQAGEYVRVGTHIAPPPERIEIEITNALSNQLDSEKYFLDRVVKFHLDFETTHPFNDGNGRIGRVLINYQLLRLGYPVVIIPFKGREKYYEALQYFNLKNSNTTKMEGIFTLALLESMHKRITYLKGQKIISLSEYAKQINKSVPTVFNSARRQTVPAFREKGVWKIGK